MSGKKDGESRFPRQQAEKALKTILESDVFAGGGSFKKAERLASLLEFIVEQTLNGEEISENSLLLDFYRLSADDLKVDNSIARLSVGRLRSKLKEYHRSQGLDDLVAIEIPVGQYRASFKYRPKSPAHKDVALGFHHVDREAPDHLRQALIHFENAIALEPEFSEGYAGKASALLTMTLHASNDDPKTYFEQAEIAAAKAVSLDKASWRGHANLGAVYLFRHEWERADDAFDEARRISPFEIDEIGGYGPYLLSRGRYKEGIELAQRYQEDGFDKPVLLVRAALYLYALRHFPEAEENLLRALELDPRFWRARLVLAFVYLALESPDKALSHTLRVEPLSGVNLWPGFRVFCLESGGRPDEAEREFADLQESGRRGYIQPMQLAFGHLALGDPVDAISFLSKACDESDPFTAWLHLWPFLDPLRRFPEFRALLRKWRFPPA
jgi:tetratricopeptide (TPR) repeat protein